MAGKVIVGLASHWPCFTDSVVYPPTGSTADVWEMSTLPKPHWGTAPLPYGLDSASAYALGREQLCMQYLPK